MNLNLDITDQPLSASDKAAMIAGFSADSASKNVPPYIRRDLSIVHRDTTGKTIAVLNGYDVWNWLYIDVLWIDPAQQKQGLGTILVQKAEDEARKRGCVGSYLWTQSFQAPEFYKKLGYQQFVTQTDFPVGHQRLGFMKRLAA